MIQTASDSDNAGALVFFLLDITGFVIAMFYAGPRVSPTPIRSLNALSFWWRPPTQLERVRQMHSRPSTSGGAR
jgi:hypothetical protein